MADLSHPPVEFAVLFPFLLGEDLNQSPTLTAPKWIINFFDWPEEKARQYPDCFSIVHERIRPERAKVKDAAARFWWRYLRPRPELYRMIEPLDRVLAIARVSKTVQPIFVKTGQVLSEKIVVFAYDDYFHFGVLTSGFHYRWAVRHSSSLRTDTNYAPSDCFETFAQPPYRLAVQYAGEALDEHRSSMMAESGLGLTSVYNLVHDPDVDSDAEVKKLRNLHIKLDVAVRDAYGWSDLDLEHGFHGVRGQGVRFTFSPSAADLVLNRLLRLNMERYDAEVAAGLHKPAKKPKARKANPANQGSLLGADQ